MPTKKPILFGHHFTSIAGTGPIVGPAIAIYLAHKKTSVRYTLIPMVFMLFMTGWAMLINLDKFFSTSQLAAVLHRAGGFYP